jgi:hypothetical protein
VSFASSLAGDDELAIGRDIEIVDGPFRPDALDLRERRGIDDIRDARVAPDRLPDPYI